MRTAQDSDSGTRFWLIALVICLSSCSYLSRPRKKACYPVKGSLFVKGKPAEGVLVLLQPKSVGNLNDWSSGFPRARVAADGKFEIETYKEKDGAPAGEYVVLLSWEVPNPPDPRKDDPGVTDKLGGRYSNPSTAKITATIADKAIELPPIRLP